MVCPVVIIINGRQDFVIIMLCKKDFSDNNNKQGSLLYGRIGRCPPSYIAIRTGGLHMIIIVIASFKSRSNNVGRISS